MKVIEKFIKLYNASQPIQDISCNTKDYKIFKENPDIRFCNSLENIRFVPTGSDSLIQSLQGFMSDNPYFWMIPLHTASQKIFGFVLKSYTSKQYRNVYASDHISCFYGWKDFQDFKKDYPIILCEGVKDCIVLKRTYSYSLACLTSGLSGVDDFDIIKKLTNKVILCYDNDSTGKFSTERDFQKLLKLGCKVNKVFYNAKDPGDLFNNQVGLSIMNNSIRNIFKGY